MTFLGVALPVYNGADYLREALDSILGQDYDDFTLVVSDNCSTDATPEILAEYTGKDPRVHVSRTEKFLSQADNVNRAVELCETTWVKLFCHDDIMLPGCLRVVQNTIADHADEQVGLIGDAPGWQFANGYRYSPYPDPSAEPRRWNGRNLMNKNLTGRAIDPLPALSTATVRRAAYMASNRFDPRFAHFDVFLWATLLLKWDYVFIPRFLVITRIHGAQVAVDARKSLRSVKDDQRFWPTYIRQNADQLNLNWYARWRGRMKSSGSAGTTLATMLRKRQFSLKLLLGIARVVPFYMLPILPLLVMRSWRRENAKLTALRGHVPIDQIYPG